MDDVDPSSLANKVAKVGGTINSGEATSLASPGLATTTLVLEIIKESQKKMIFEAK